MNETSEDPRTPGRRAGAPSSPLASHDLARRLGRLPVPREAIPRLARFVEEEVARALEAQEADAFGADEIAEVAGDDELLSKLRERREERRRVEAIRRAGLHEAPAEELEAVLARAQGKE